MEDNMKKCPYCGEMIAQDALKCEYCNEDLETFVQKATRISKEVAEKAKEKYKETAEEKIKAVKLPKIEKMPVIISAVAIAVIAIISLCVKIENDSVNKVFATQTEENLPIEILSSIKDDEKLLNEYLQKSHTISNKSKVFNIFMRRTRDNIEAFNNNLELWEYFDYNFERAHRTLEKKGQIIVRQIGFKQNEDGSIYISTFDAPFIRMPMDGEGGYWGNLNYKYLNETYSKFLNQPSAEFLEQLAKEEAQYKGFDYTADGAITVTKEEITDRLLFWLDFRKKYPKFVEYSAIVRDLINMYTCDLLTDAYQTWNWDFKTGDSVLNDTAKKCYERFLEQAKAYKNTKEYKMVKECYEILKKNNFKYNDEFGEKMENFRQISSHT